MRTPYRVLETRNGIKLVMLRLRRQWAIRSKIEAQEAAAERLREFISDWTEPEQLDVENLITELRFRA